MMKTTISICCDRCEKVLSEDELIHGIQVFNNCSNAGGSINCYDLASTSSMNYLSQYRPYNDTQYFYCEECYNRLLDDIIDHAINTILKEDPSYTEHPVSVSVICPPNNKKIFKVAYLKTLYTTQYKYSIIAFNEFNWLAFSISSLKEHKEEVKSSIIDTFFKNAFDHGTLKDLRSMYKRKLEEKNYQANIVQCNNTSTVHNL